MAYEPRGKPADLLAAMRASPVEVWDAAMVAQAMEIPKGNVAAYLHAVLSNQLLYSKVENGRSRFSLKPFPTAAAPAHPRSPQVAPGWVPPKMIATRPGSDPIPKSTGALPPAAVAPAPPAVARPPAPVTVAAAPKVEEPPEAVEEAEEQDDEPPEIRWTHWDDGDLVIYGLQENEDGSHTIPAAVLARIKARIAWSPLA